MTCLSKCSGYICGRKESCLRFTAPIHDPKTQSWIHVMPTGECEEFISNGIPEPEPMFILSGKDKFVLNPEYKKPDQ